MTTPIPSNRAEIDAETAARATRGRVAISHGPRTARGITTDSRAVVAGSAFVALRGERYDGHAFLDAAVEAGAVLLVVERGRAPRGAHGADLVEVDDTLAAWGAIARAHLHAWRDAAPAGRVVAITGSAGKTTTKELCAALLRTAGSCLASAGNLNNRVGVPAVALQLGVSHRFGVLEVGMSIPGEIAALGAVVEPDVAVVTNAGLAHAGGVGGTVDDVAREKGALFEAVRPGGSVVANADDAAVISQVGRARGARVITFGRQEGADVRLVERRPLGIEGSAVDVRRQGGRAATFRVPIPGEAAALDFVAALAAADAALGVALDDALAADALASFPVLAGRMHVRRLRGGGLLLDDAYNASPATVLAALSTLAELSAGRRVAVLGEMKELGPAAAREHTALGAAIAAAGVALLVTCGGMADAAAAAAERLGVAVARGRDADDAARIAVAQVRAGDFVLVKASRSVGAERVVDALLQAHGGEGA
jgi:UDP-N-acetylmuramoyl-tripeptide--D-alanyl-D-alanine ligase